MTATTTQDGIRPNWQKFALLLSALSIMLVLVLVGRVEWADVSGPFGIIVGYGAANGIGASRGQVPTPLFLPVNPRRRTGDTDEVQIVAASGESIELTPEQHRAAERARRRAEADARRSDDGD